QTKLLATVKLPAPVKSPPRKIKSSIAAGTARLTKPAALIAAASVAPGTPCGLQFEASLQFVPSPAPLHVKVCPAAPGVVTKTVTGAEAKMAPALSLIWAVSTYAPGATPVHE